MVPSDILSEGQLDSLNHAHQNFLALICSSTAARGAAPGPAGLEHGEADQDAEEQHRAGRGARPGQHLGRRPQPHQAGEVSHVYTKQRVKFWFCF